MRWEKEQGVKLSEKDKLNTPRYYLEPELSLDEAGAIMSQYSPGPVLSKEEHLLSRELLASLLIYSKEEADETKFTRLINAFDQLTDSIYETLDQAAENPQFIEYNEDRIDGLVEVSRAVWILIVEDYLEQIEADRFAAIDSLATLCEDDIRRRRYLIDDVCPGIELDVGDEDIHHAMNLIIKRAGSDSSLIPAQIADKVTTIVKKDIRSALDRLKTRKG